MDGKKESGKSMLSAGLDDDDYIYLRENGNKTDLMVIYLRENSNKSDTM